jgi:HAD superfamily hydrolase (TIGR01549 family)
MVTFYTNLRAFRATPANDAMFDICKSLSGKYLLGIITDNSRDRFEAVKDEMNLSAIFDYFLVSGEIGSRKDRPEIFIDALKQTGSEADECVFIDNNRANLVIPKQLGFETLFHDHTQNDVEYLVTCLKHVGVTL